jgi:cytochrome c oxidase assembly protein subunit 15
LVTTARRSVNEALKTPVADGNRLGLSPKLAGFAKLSRSMVVSTRRPENVSSFGNVSNSASPRGFFPRRHRFAVLTAAATFVLIFVGGLVTSTGSSLSVPDWPLSYGQFFPPMVGGVFYEHGHRMVAGTVAALTAALALWTWREEPRRSVRWLGVAALVTILLQAALGGVTVLLRLPTAVSVSHAALAQAFFCLVVALALITGPDWLSSRAERRGDPWVRRLSIATTIAVYGQLLLGAVMRHTGSGLAIPDFPLSYGKAVPEITSFAVAIHFAHRVGAVIVSGLALATAARVFAAHRDDPRWVRPILWLLVLVAIQVSLGASIIWSRKAVLPTTAHVAVGAAILAVSLVLTLRSRRTREDAAESTAGPLPQRASA